MAAQARGVLKNKADIEMLDIRHQGDGRTYEDKLSKFLVQKSPWSQMQHSSHHGSRVAISKIALKFKQICLDPGASERKSGRHGEWEARFSIELPCQSSSKRSSKHMG
jgi:hypothetical protein